MMQNRVTLAWVSMVRRSAACAAAVKLSASSRMMSLKGGSPPLRGKRRVSGARATPPEPRHSRCGHRRAGKLLHRVPHHRDAPFVRRVQLTGALPPLLRAAPGAWRCTARQPARPQVARTQTTPVPLPRWWTSSPCLGGRRTASVATAQGSVSCRAHQRHAAAVHRTLPVLMDVFSVFTTSSWNATSSTVLGRLWRAAHGVPPRRAAAFETRPAHALLLHPRPQRVWPCRCRGTCSYCCCPCEVHGAARGARG